MVVLLDILFGFVCTVLLLSFYCFSLYEVMIFCKISAKINDEYTKIERVFFAWGVGSVIFTLTLFGAYSLLKYYLGESTSLVMYSLWVIMVLMSLGFLSWFMSCILFPLHNYLVEEDYSDCEKEMSYASSMEDITVKEYSLDKDFSGDLVEGTRFSDIEAMMGDSTRVDSKPSADLVLESVSHEGEVDESQAVFCDIRDYLDNLK